MATPRVLTIPDQTSHAWKVNNKGEMLGDLWFTKNIDLESSTGKVRLAERIAILYDQTDFSKWAINNQYSRAFARTDADGTDRWWSLIGISAPNTGSPFWNTAGTDSLGVWAEDVIAMAPATAKDSMEVFIKNNIAPLVNSYSILSSTDSTPIQITLVASGTPLVASGQQVTVSGHATNTNANGTWTVQKVSTYVFTLIGTTGTGGGAGGNTGTMSIVTTPASVGNDMMIASDGNGDLNMLNASGNVKSFAISSSTNTSPIQITLVTSGTDSGIFTGNQVTITGHTVNTNANGTWTVTRISAFVFLLNGSTGNGVGGGDGTVATSAWKLVWWTGNLGQQALNTSYPVVLKKFDVNKLMLVGNGNAVHTIDSSLNVAYNRLVFPTGYFINCIVGTPDYAWFFLSSLNNKPAIAARWNGGEENYETPITLYDYNVYAASHIDSIPYCLNGKGQLLRFNGQAFEELDVLPCFNSKQRWGDGSTILNNTVCNRNGMTVIDGLIHVLLKSTMNNDSNDKTTLENFSSGVWCYDPSNGFYCKYSVGNYRSTDGDWGDKVLLGAGALTETTIDKGRLLLGASFYTTAIGNAANSAIFVSKVGSTTLQRGQIITRQIHIPSLVSMYVHLPMVRSIWKSVSYSFERFMESSDYVIMKIRTSKSQTRTYQKIDPMSWTSGTTFTGQISGSPCLASALVGDEIEIVAGPGAGGTFHISTITIVGNNVTVVLDETVPSAANGLQSTSYLNNWTKISSVNGSNMGIQEKIVSLIRNSSWIQLKIELRGTAVSPELKDCTIQYEALGR